MRGLGTMPAAICFVMRMKTRNSLLAISLIAGGFCLVNNSFAEKAKSSPEAIVEELLESQNTSEVTELECERISDQMFERLGKAVAWSTHSDTSDFTMMHRMMGGRNSETTRNWYRRMGARYLGCLPGSVTGAMRPTRPWPWSEWENSFEYGDAGYQGDYRGRGGPFTPWGHREMMYGWGNIIVWILIGIAVILATVLAVKSAQSPDKSREEKARDILEKRYARGEISQDEYRRIKHDIS